MTPEQERDAGGLMSRAQQGDGAAYAELLTLLAATARRFARNRFGDVAWLDDVAQETLVTVHAARHTYDPRRPFAPWFYAILSSRMIDVLRRERRIAGREVGTYVLPDTGPSMTSTPAREIDGRFDRVRQALDILPARQRDVVSALKLREESVKEIGARLGMSESAVKVTAHRGYRALRRLLGSREL